MTYRGGCHCGAVRYELTGAPRFSTICHCADCRRSAAAPLVAWVTFEERALAVTMGAPKVRTSSANAQRSFCAECGSGLFYRNAQMLPGLIDVQTATLDNPNAFPPTLQLQVAERIPWMQWAHRLPEHERFV